MNYTTFLKLRAMNLIKCPFLDEKRKKNLKMKLQKCKENEERDKNKRNAGKKSEGGGMWEVTNKWM